MVSGECRNGRCAARRDAAARPSNCREQETETHVNSIGLAVAGNILNLAHHDDKRSDTAKKGVASALIILPGSKQVGKPLLEELAVDLDGVCHDDRFSECRGGRVMLVFDVQSAMTEQQAVLHWLKGGQLQSVMLRVERKATNSWRSASLRQCSQ